MCDSHYHTVMGCGCYRVTTRLAMGWSSLGDCFTHGGHPVDIGSEVENNMIIDHLNDWQQKAGVVHRLSDFYKGLCKSWRYRMYRR